MKFYTIRYGHCDNSFFVASNSVGEFIVIEAFGSDFKIGHQVLCDGVGIVNETLNKRTGAVVRIKTHEEGAYKFLRSLK
ncbi:hypothetical protein MWMV2_MWMV2_00017 [Acinetobacter oleivorans]|jgi:hypothetical protein|nr:hypothetical protein MWMV12_MWMV12_00017 [Acinetobacter oleivorans]CAI3099515.1 hypothetical protein MWMV19_MWMV19_00017 [Acinetobacter oleivorans]CAI3099525.1 hypothetical protein MWMV3_MWMV3_00017 [Acinetobacter oleivorans]CAI3099553.1 hypothetical protein MWMV2_MWMV2_00017 [Acinetobacter oleivorans]CAI3118984.1 hypothetical protein MWMV5_MWMV5_01109 [Acinetobacter oleivorans]